MSKEGAPKEVAEGLRFRYLIADERVLWEVEKHIGSDYWECVALNETLTVHGETMDGDYAGRLKAFHTSEILGALGVDAIFGGYDPANYEPQNRVHS